MSKMGLDGNGRTEARVAMPAGPEGLRRKQVFLHTRLLLAMILAAAVVQLVVLEGAGAAHYRSSSDD